MAMSPIVDIIFGCMPAQIMYTAAELGIADLLAGGPRSSTDLATTSETDAPALRRLLRALAGLGVTFQTDTDTFALTELGHQLRSDTPDSVRSVVLLLAGPEAWRAWGDLTTSVRTGEPAWERVTGRTFFEHLAEHPEKATTFNTGMAEHTRGAAPDLVATHDFSRFRSLVDVGGGNGTLVAEILRAHPSMTGTLLDMPSGLTGAADTLAAAGVTDRCRVAPGDFFAAVPEGADAYVLKSVLHDWNDDGARTILRNCRRAMAPDGRVLVLERVLPPIVTPEALADHLGDIEMMILPGGIERTEQDYRDLLATAGFAVTAVSGPLPRYGLCLVEATPTAR